MVDAANTKLHFVRVGDLPSESDEGKILISVAKTVFSKAFPKQFLEMAAAGRCEVPSPFSGKAAGMIAGRYEEGAADGVYGNFLLFRDEAGLDFILLQRLRFTVCLIIPALNLVVHEGIGSEEEEIIQASESHIYETSSVPASNAKCRGLLIGGYRRPYHQVYDELPLLSWALDNLNLPAFVNRRRSYFPEECFGPTVRTIELSAPENQGWKPDVLLLPGRSTGGNRGWRPDGEDTIHGVARVTQTLGRRPPTPSALKFGAWAAGHFPIIWIGVCDMKQRWIDPLSAISELITSIKSEFPDAGFVFDGRTALIREKPESVIKRHSADEAALVDKLKSSLQIASASFSLVGCHALDKIQVAEFVDFFVTNVGTDSVWCALFHRKPGLVHYAPEAWKDLRIRAFHPLTVRVPNSIITAGDNSAVSHRMSYALNSSRFAALALDAIKRTLLLTPYCKMVRGEEGRMIVSDASGTPLQFFLDPGRYQLRIDLGGVEEPVIHIRDHKGNRVIGSQSPWPQGETTFEIHERTEISLELETSSPNLDKVRAIVMKETEFPPR